MMRYFEASDLPHRITRHDTKSGAALDVLACVRSEELAHRLLDALPSVEPQYRFSLDLDSSESLAPEDYTYMVSDCLDRNRPVIIAASVNAMVAFAAFDIMALTDPSGRYTAQQGMRVIKRYPRDLEV